MYQNDSLLTKLIKFHFLFWTKIGICFQYLIVKIEKRKKIFLLLSLFSFIVLILVIRIFKKIFWLQTIVLLLFSFSFLCCSSSQENTPLVKLRGFLNNSIFCYFLGLLNVFFIIKFGSNLIAIPLVYVLGFSIPWIIYSSIARAEVSVLGNAILTVLIGFIPSFLDYMNITFLSDFFNSNEMVGEAFKIVWFPFLFSSSVGTIVSLIKQYWVEKYNENDDVHILTSEELQQPISNFFKNSSDNIGE